MTKHCDRCGGPLACYESERYCPNCCTYTLAGEVAVADAEASVQRVLEARLPAKPGEAQEVNGLADRPRRARRGTGAV
jgi:uncharacterized Zn finger protein (UPF0148 family)